MEVFFVRAEVLCKVCNPRREKSDLNFGGPSVLLADFVFVNNFGFIHVSFLVQGLVAFPFGKVVRQEVELPTNTVSQRVFTLKSLGVSG